MKKIKNIVWFIIIIVFYLFSFELVLYIKAGFMILRQTCIFYHTDWSVI